MDNKMTEVAKLLGVKLEEEFCTTESSVKYKLTERGLRSYSKTRDWWDDASYTLTRLLAGGIKVESSPWEPKMGEDYYIPRPDTVVRFAIFRWRGDENDVYRHRQDLVCKSANEAIGVAEKMLTALYEENNDE